MTSARGTSRLRSWAGPAAAIAAAVALAAWAALTIPRPPGAAALATITLDRSAGASAGPSPCADKSSQTAPLPVTGLAFTVTVGTGGAAVSGLAFSAIPSTTAAAPRIAVQAQDSTGLSQDADAPVTAAGGYSDVMLSRTVVLPVYVAAGTAQAVSVRVMPDNSIGDSPVTWSVTALGEQGQSLGTLCMAS